MGRNRNPGWAISSVPEALAAEFSTRSRHIDVETDRLIDDYVERHGHRPSAAVIMKLRAQATLSTRPEKTLHSLSDLTAGWRDRAGAILGEDATKWAQQVASKLPAAVRIGKRAFHRQTGQSTADAYAMAGGAMCDNMMLPDTDEGLTAFLEKRPPRWAD